jgi:hypothetical protein
MKKISLLTRFEAFHVSQFNMLPVTGQHVRKGPHRDCTLVQVHEHVMNGWHENKDPNLQSFYVGEQSCHSHKVTKQSITSIT